jgi:hypothetical protein
MIDTQENETLLDLAFEKEYQTFVWEQELKETYNRAELHALIQKGDPESLCRAWHINQAFGYYPISQMFELRENKVLIKLYNFFSAFGSPQSIAFTKGNVLPIHLTKDWQYCLFVSFHKGYADIENSLTLLYNDTYLFPMIFWKIDRYVKLFLNQSKVKFRNFELHYEISGCFEFVERAKNLLTEKVFALKNANSILELVPPHKDEYDLPF